MADIGKSEFRKQIELWTTYLVEGNEIEMKKLIQKLKMSVVMDKKYLATKIEMNKELQKKVQEYILNEPQIRIQVPNTQDKIQNNKKEKDMSDLMKDIRVPKKIHVKRGDAPKIVF